MLSQEGGLAHAMFESHSTSGGKPSFQTALLHRFFSASSRMATPLSSERLQLVETASLGFAQKVVTPPSWVDENRTGSGSDRVCVALGQDPRKGGVYVDCVRPGDLVYRKCDPVATAPGSVFIDPRQGSFTTLSARNSRCGLVFVHSRQPTFLIKTDARCDGSKSAQPRPR
jgi:hypothetical protein